MATPTIATSPRVAITHRTRYVYQHPVFLSPHRIRLRPAPLLRTRMEAYALTISPRPDALHWQEDAFGNWIARAAFTEPSACLEIEVTMVARMAAANPFDFLVAHDAERYPFDYAKDERQVLAPYLECGPPGPRLAAWLERARDGLDDVRTVDFLTAMNRAVARDVRYVQRQAPGVQASEETLELGSGSCRDSGWLLTEVLRRGGLAARFVSGYLVQLTEAGAKTDSVDLHAWSEAYVPGAGWIGLDPTSGLLAAQGHLPLARGVVPASAAAVEGYADPARSKLSTDMRVVRLAAEETPAGLDAPLHTFRYRQAGTEVWREAAEPAALEEIQGRYAEYELTGRMPPRDDPEVAS